MRLNRFLAMCGLGSRRKCEQFIREGKISVDGKVIDTLGTIIDEDNSTITFEGKKLEQPSKFSYILMNKPNGVVTTAKDELNRKTVLDLLPTSVRVFPVGRLDKNTTGVLLLTNDGGLAYKLTHPKYSIDKVYQVILKNEITDQDKAKLQSGILLEDGITSPCKVKINTKDRRKIEITIHEGRKRQIRRMLKSLGYSVLKLERLQFAILTTSDLKIGEWRYLTKNEIRELKALLPNKNEPKEN